jgi:carboxyl-terminal processing protease
MATARVATISLFVFALAACGGGGGDGGVPAQVGSPSGNYTPGVYQPRGTFAGQCSTTTLQNHFLRSWTNELYLWYREVPDIDPSTMPVAQYFASLKTPQTTASGRAKDRFHSSLSTEQWQALSRSGIEAGYGVQWFLISDRPPRRVVAAFVEPGTPAVAPAVNLTRGVEVLIADGVDVINGNTQAAVDTLNAAFFPSAPNQSHTFTIRELNGMTRSISMTSVNVTHTPVLDVRTLDQGGVPVGYILFNDHIATAETQLRNAITTLNNQNIVDLVLDVRYNGGGFLDIASELAFMIAGPTLTTGRVFERIQFNDKHPSTNPVLQQPLAPTPFHTTTKIVAPTGQQLPTLDLQRLYVITGPGTCSASESIINGLRGVGIEVYLIGSRTCGKPFGFYPQDNCGTTYFSIQFQGVNEQGFGAYEDGFLAQNDAGAGGVDVPGCSVGDDFTRGLGDPNEGRLAATLAFRASNNQNCPAATGFAPDILSKAGQQRLDATDGVMVRSPLRENRILQ